MVLKVRVKKKCPCCGRIIMGSMGNYKLIEHIIKCHTNTRRGNRSCKLRRANCIRK